MHIELTELLRCPGRHGADHLVLSTGEMRGRSVRFGTVGCPVCRREFRIAEGTVDFTAAGGDQPDRAVRARATGGAAARRPLPPDVLQAALDLSGPGGVVALVGGAARHASGLAGLMDGVHFVGINAPPDVEELPALSLLVADGEIPLRDAMVRGVVVGAEAAAGPWLAESLRVLLPGRRIVVQDERAGPPGATLVAAGDGVWVGEKR